MTHPLFDFRSVTPGQRLTRLCIGQIDEAQVTVVDENYFVCRIVTDAPRLMQFDRNNGVAHDVAIGDFVINKPPRRNDPTFRAHVAADLMQVLRQQDADSPRPAIQDWLRHLRT